MNVSLVNYVNHNVARDCGAETSETFNKYITCHNFFAEEGVSYKVLKMPKIHYVTTVYQGTPYITLEIKKNSYYVLCIYFSSPASGKVVDRFHCNDFILLLLSSK